MTNSTKSILIIEDNINDFCRIKNIVEKDWNILPKLDTSEELNRFLWGTDSLQITKREEIIRVLKHRIPEYLLSDNKYEFISLIILDLKFSNISNDDESEGYYILNEIRNMFIKDQIYMGWNNLVPIFVLSGHKNKIRRILSGNQMANLYLYKNEIWEDKKLLNDYLNHTYNYFKIIKQNLVHYNSLYKNLDNVNYQLKNLSENFKNLEKETYIILNATFQNLEPSERQKLIDSFDDYLPDDFKNKFEATYFSKLKEDLKQNVDDIELFIKTLQFAPITIFTTLHDMVMNVGLYKLKK